MCIYFSYAVVVDNIYVNICSQQHKHTFNVINKYVKKSISLQQIFLQKCKCLQGA